MYITSKSQGNTGHIQDMQGMDLVMLPKKTIRIIEEAVILNENIVDEDEVKEVLHIGKKTLSNYCASGKIPKEDYTTSVTGRRFFFLPKLLGMKRPVQLELPIQ